MFSSFAGLVSTLTVCLSIALLDFLFPFESVHPDVCQFDFFLELDKSACLVLFGVFSSAVFVDLVILGYVLLLPFLLRHC